MQFIETSVFTRQVTALLADDVYRQLQAVLTARPDTGLIIPHSGGLRKMRWAMEGRGKRGYARLSKRSTNERRTV